jgi:biotin operon repressor
MSKKSNVNLEMSVEEMMLKISELESKLVNKSGGRKLEVLELLKNGYDSIEAISNELNINSKNVSSVLSGLRKDGHTIISYKVKGSNVVSLIGEEGLKING